MRPSFFAEQKRYVKRNCRNKHIVLWTISNITRNTLEDFMWKCRWNIRWRKMWAFLPAECLHRIPCLFHVWTIRRVHVRHTGDNGRTFWCPLWHLFTDNIKPREPNSPASAIKNRADADSDSGFARLCFVQRCHKGHTQKSYKLSSGMRTWPAECSKLGKTRIIEDANIRLVRNATFFEPNFHLHFHLKSHGVVFL